MKIEYIFIRKENVSTKIEDNLFTTTPPLHVVLGKIFTNVSQDTINLKYKTKEYSVPYHYVEHECENDDGNSAIQYLTIELNEGRKSSIAEVLDTIHQKIFSHDEKKNYDIIISYDGLSKYYCDRLYPLLNEFERQIRNLIFKLLTRSFGALWLDITTTQEQQNNIKAKLQISSKSLRNQKMIEEALYEMDIKDLENYLFVPWSDMTLLELCTDEFTNEKLKKLSQKEAIELIRNLRPVSIWDRYFAKEVTIPNLQDKLNSIRKYRNKVAHAKYLHKADYTACKAILSEILPQLETAIQDVSVEKYDTKQLHEFIRGMANTCTSVIKRELEIGRTLSPAIEAFSRKIAEYGSVFQQPAVSQALAMQNHFPGLHQSMIELSSVLDSLPSLPLVQSAMQLQNLCPPSSVMESIAAAQEHLLKPSVLESIELTSKALSSRSVLSSYQSAQSYQQEPEFVRSMQIAEQTKSILQSPAVESVLRTNQMIEQMTRVQNLGINTYKPMDGSEQDEFPVESEHDDTLEDSVENESGDNADAE